MKKKIVDGREVCDMVHYTPKFTVYFYLTTSPMQVRGLQKVNSFIG